MKNKKIFSLLNILFLFSSCYYPISYTYNIDLKSGIIEVAYYNLRSDEDVDSSINRDWHDLRKSLKYNDSLYNTRYYSVISRKLFQEDTVLSGKFIYRIESDDSSYSITELLKEITGSKEEHTVSWHATNEEIFLFVDNDADYILKNSNGKQMSTERANVSVWSLNDSLFNFTFSVDSGCPGVSLLSYYLKDKSIKKEKKSDK